MSSKNEPPQLTEYYHRARRNLTITSSLLLGWEFIGASFDENATLPVVGFVIHIRNPEVTPLTLAFFVLFFSFRLWIEWKQCDVERVKSAFSKADLISVYVIASASIALFGFQQTSSVDLAKIIEQYGRLSLIFLCIIVNFCIVYIDFIRLNTTFQINFDTLNSNQYSLDLNDEMYKYKYEKLISFNGMHDIFPLLLFAVVAIWFYYIDFSEYTENYFYKYMLWFSGPLLLVFVRMVYKRRAQSLFSCPWPRKSVGA